MVLYASLIWADVMKWNFNVPTKTVKIISEHLLREHRSQAEQDFAKLKSEQEHQIVEQRVRHVTRLNELEREQQR